ncbi:Zeta toxin [Prauserella marina]|uniref:AAA domain-containing protein n=1 Tax=Prauserella marina TaxID=530584 RepID=A0A222VUD8_9PSEU|nr:AAA family ATPase [Prauserella marina]ASR37528.1 Zeta toxin [Prauserella marina]PWV75423.1 AAA domain-containing protein [Prauserella marina]SDD34905.1 AAA domain-containing protein [Prauserella marina]
MNCPISDQLCLRLDRRALVVVAGLPGAGKSTLLRGLDAPPTVVVLDTDQLRTRLRAFFGPGIAYGWYRPLVHLLQILRLLFHAIRAKGPVVAHDPATGAVARCAFVLLGALSLRERHLLWIDCSVTEALAGQHKRGRVLLSWSFRRHARNATGTRDRIDAGRLPFGWHTATLTDRAKASKGLRLEIDEPAGAGIRRRQADHRRGRR